ncbi:MAG: PorT family protein [Ignavibacteriae bacterium]|nr:PorT family protein [Ignavibacteriota bacterium]
MYKANFRFRIKYLLLLIFVFAIQYNSQAQNINSGIKGGLNIAKTSLKIKYEEIQSKTGFNIYVFGDYNFTHTFSISTEAGYTQKGFKYAPPDYTYEGVKYSGTLNVNMNYIDITVSAKFRLAKGNVIPYLKIGPSLGIKVDDGVSSEGNAFDEFYNSGAIVNNLLIFIKNNSFGLKSGAGVAIGLNKKTSIIFEINYNFDLTEVYDTPEIFVGVYSWSRSEDVKNNVLELSAGVQF